MWSEKMQCHRSMCTCWVRTNTTQSLCGTGSHTCQFSNDLRRCTSVLHPTPDSRPWCTSCSHWLQMRCSRSTPGRFHSCKSQRCTCKRLYQVPLYPNCWSDRTRDCRSSRPLCCTQTYICSRTDLCWKHPTPSPSFCGTVNTLCQRLARHRTCLCRTSRCDCRVRC